MSVRAYILREVHIRYDEDKVIFERVLDIEPLFKLSYNIKVFELFQEYGCDFTNYDLLGEIGLSKKCWLDFKKEFNEEEWGNDDLKILFKIDDEFRKEEELWCECF